MTAAALAPLAAPAERPAPLDLAAVYAREFDWVWATLRRLGVAARNLPDVTHDVFVVVHRRAHTYDPARPLRPWLFGVAYRVARDHLALARNRREAVVEAPELADPAPAQDQALDRAQSRALVLAALQEVELDRRVVFILHDLEEQPMPEIAAALDVPVKTLYSRLAAARAEFTAAVRRLRLRRGETP
ncbi:MAG: sigma-70 family RNA polymerase sigma factor [Polyangiales bacterium]